MNGSVHRVLVLVNKPSMQCRAVETRKVAFIRSSVTRPDSGVSKMAAVSLCACAELRSGGGGGIPETGAGVVYEISNYYSARWLKAWEDKGDKEARERNRGVTGGRTMGNNGQQ
jgi:hypothetical protein